MRENRQWSMANGLWSSMPKLLLFYFSFFIFHFSFAQKISATPDREKIILGEQVTLQLKVEDFNPRMFFIGEWFNVPDTFNHIQVVKREPIDTVDVNGYTTYLQKITLTSFDSGKWQLSPLNIIVQEISSGKQTHLKADDIFLEVLPVDVSGLSDYHDIKDILEVPEQTDYWFIAEIAASVILLIIFAWLLFRRKKKITPGVEKPVLKGTAYDRAMEKLKILQHEKLPSKGQAKLFYQTLDEICRNYFDEHLQIGSLKSTSDEMIISLKIYLTEEPVRSKFYQLIRLTDVVKFAKYIPGEAQNKESTAVAISTIQFIHNLHMHIQKSNAD